MNTFPLHQLPDKEYTHALRSMEIYDQLSYSLCSKNTKRAVKSLNLRARDINFCVSDCIEMEMCFENYTQIFCWMKHGYYFPDNKIIAREGIEVSVYERGKITEWKWNFPNFEFKEWLHHFCEVLHHPRINDVNFNSEHIDDYFIDPVLEVIKGLQLGWLFLSEQSTNEFIKEALKSFCNYEKLSITRAPFDNKESYKMDNVLIQNLKRFSIWEAQRFKIDQVLSSNCEEVELTDSTLTREDFKVFVKLWIHGSNSKLKHFSARRRLIPTQLSPPFNEKSFFKGIEYKKIPMDSEEVIKMEYELCSYEIKLAGGFRIRRFDGTNAVIMIYKRMFQLIVV